MILHDFIIDEYIKNALKEDLNFGDITTDILAQNKTLKAKMNTRENGILCGIDVAMKVFQTLDPSINIKKYFNDGDKISKNDTLAIIEGSASAILSAERTALNFIQRMSGISTETAKYQAAIGNNKARITDTRKTTPNFRIFEKYAVFKGGARLHRFNLSDCVMIKDNHIILAGSITNAVSQIKKHISHAHKIEVECDTLEQVKEALSNNVDIIMLDNMPCPLMKQCVELINGNAIVEASGNVTLENIENIAKTGIDVISSSAIVAKAKTLDIALDI